MGNATKWGMRLSGKTTDLEKKIRVGLIIATCKDINTPCLEKTYLKRFRPYPTQTCVQLKNRVRGSYFMIRHCLCNKGYNVAKLRAVFLFLYAQCRHSHAVAELFLLIHRTDISSSGGSVFLFKIFSILVCFPRIFS